MADNQPLPDYYAVLQVHPDADQEVIEAAYRQLMKKYHPDLAGSDFLDATARHRAASSLNRAYSVLRDPEQRRNYDRARLWGATQRPADRPDAGSRGTRTDASTPPPPKSTEAVDAGPGVAVTLPLSSSEGPLAWIAAIYYMLPGPYEWEDGKGADIAATLMVPVVGTLAYALLAGRFAGLSGGSVGGSLVLSALLLLLAIPLIRIAGRVMLTAVPPFMLLTGMAAPVLSLAHAPIWLAWGVVTSLGVVIGARLFVFGVLPMLALCWWVDRLPWA